MRRVRVPEKVVDEVLVWLREAGRLGCEGVAFWAGVQEGTRFDVLSSYVPRQVAGRSGDGVMVVVPGEELFKMNVWLHRNALTLIAQLHSHPTEAYHSGTDDDFAVMARVGGLSIVVPDYARDSFTLDTAAVYRLGDDGAWAALTPDDARALIEIV